MNDRKDRTAKLEQKNRTYEALSLSGSILGAFAVCMPILWLIQRAGFSILYWWPLAAGIALASGYQLAFILAKQRYERGISTNAPADDTLAAKYLAAKIKYAAQVFRWAIPLACLAPVISTVFSIPTKTYMMVMFVLLLTLANSMTRRKAAQEKSQSHHRK